MFLPALFAFARKRPERPSNRRLSKLEASSSRRREARVVQFNQGGKGSRERRVLEIFRNESSFLLSLDSRASVIYLCRIEVFLFLPFSFRIIKDCFDHFYFHRSTFRICLNVVDDFSLLLFTFPIFIIFIINSCEI